MGRLSDGLVICPYLDDRSLVRVRDLRFDELKKSLGNHLGAHFRIDRNEVNFFQASKPGHLTLGELPRSSLNLLDRAGSVDPRRPAWRSLHDSRSPAPPRRTRVRAPPEASNLVDEPVIEKLDDAAIDAGVQAGTGEIERKDGNFGGRGPIVLGLEVADRPASELEHLQGADDTATILGMKAGGGRRVECGQSLVERSITALECFVLEPLAELSIGARALEQTPQQHFQVEGRSADEEGPLAAGLDHAAPPRRPSRDMPKHWRIARGR